MKPEKIDDHTYVCHDCGRTGWAESWFKDGVLVKWVRTWEDPKP
jgi:uncharacterized protein with PIN domain